MCVCVRVCVLRSISARLGWVQHSCVLSAFSAFHAMGKSARYAKRYKVGCETVANHSISMSAGLKLSRSGRFSI